MGGKKILLTAALAVTAGLLFFAGPSEAVHKGAGGLTCGQCHTMHNSQGRQTLIYNAGSYATPITAEDPSMILLRGRVTGRQNIHNLCLQCHGEGGAQAAIVQNGSNVTPPKVYLAPGTRTWKEGDAFNSIGAGGDFSYTGSWDGAEFKLFAKDFEDGDPFSGYNCGNGMASRGKGHSIGCRKVVPPGADTEVGLDLSCTSCHDPHGTAIDPGISGDAYINRYRNLRYNPVGGGGGAAPDIDGPVYVYGGSYVGGVTGLSAGSGNYKGVAVKQNMPPEAYATQEAHVWPVWVGTDTVNAAGVNQNTYNAPFGPQAKADGSVTFTQEGIGAWCAQCHDKWHEASAEGNKSPTQRNLFYDGRKIDINCQGTTSVGMDWRRHPVDNPLVGDTTPCSTGGVEIIRYDNYVSIPEGWKLPAANTSGVKGNESYYANAKTDKVFCLSCHFVHGGPYNDNLRWDYTEDDADGAGRGIRRGFQIGNAIATNIGCQQCHNR